MIIFNLTLCNFTFFCVEVVLLEHHEEDLTLEIVRVVVFSKEFLYLWGVR